MDEFFKVRLTQLHANWMELFECPRYMKGLSSSTIPKCKGIPPSACSSTSNIWKLHTQKAKPLRYLAMRTMDGRTPQTCTYTFLFLWWQPLNRTYTCMGCPEISHPNSRFPTNFADSAIHFGLLCHPNSIRSILETTLLYGTLSSVNWLLRCNQNYQLKQFMGGTVSHAVDMHI